MPPISLLIPCYNAARYLPRLVATIREQTRPFAEILCYDDGSTDDTVQVACDLGLKIIVGGQNQGPAYARNRLADAARSPWIHFHDADDLLTPHYVERVSPLLSDSVDVVVCQTDWLLETTREPVMMWRYRADALAIDAVAANLINPICLFACVFRRDLFLRGCRFNEQFRTWEDCDFQVRLAHGGARYRVLNEVLVLALRHDHGASSVERGDRNLEDRTRLLESYLRTLDMRHHPAVAAAAESHASFLLATDRRPDLADRDLAICQTVGWPVPSTKNPLLRVARLILPGRWLLRIQTITRWRLQILHSKAPKNPY